MAEHARLASDFEGARQHLRGVAYRILGAQADADDAVQEAWLRASRVDAAELDAIENLEGWLTTIVARISLDMLRSRGSRREESIDDLIVDSGAALAGRGDAPTDPEQEALLAESVGLALLVVLDRLPPAERVAFVLHDIFDVPFDTISNVLGRSPDAARQLASRARRRVRGGSLPDAAELARQRAVVDAYVAASRAGNIDALLEVLAPDVELRVDAVAVPSGMSTVVRGAQTVARRAVTFSARAPQARQALVDGKVSMIIAPLGHLTLAFVPTIAGGKITAIDIIADPSRLSRLELAVLDD